MLTPTSKFYHHYYYDEENKTIWYYDDKPETDPPGYVFLGSSNNPIPASAATALTQKRSDIKGCRVKRRL